MSQSYWCFQHICNFRMRGFSALGPIPLLDLGIHPRDCIIQITECYHSLALRHFLISAHYRSPLNYSISQLENSSDAIYYIFQVSSLQNSVSGILCCCLEVDGLFKIVKMLFHKLLQGETKKNEKVLQINEAAKECIKKLNVEFQRKMLDDLQTLVILTDALQEALKFVNTSLKMLKKKMQKRAQLQLIQSLLEVEKVVGKVLDVIGLLSSKSYVKVQEKKVKKVSYMNVEKELKNQLGLL